MIIRRLLAASALLAALAAGEQVRAEAAATTTRKAGAQDTSNPEAGGRHWRISAQGGAMHVWVPSGYQRATAGVVIYVHGYFVDVDTAWREHKLASQFSASRQNALFIAVPGPQSKTDPVYSPSLQSVLSTVRRAGFHVPAGPRVAVGHSGAYRTLASWTDNTRLSEIIMLDGMYAEQPLFASFLARVGTKMILVAEDTLAQCQEFIRQFSYAVRLSSIPDTYEHLPRSARRGRLVLLRSQHEHSDIVLGGAVIPLLLRVTPLKLLGAAPKAGEKTSAASSPSP